jgi:Fe2+ transport system protein FeoA
MRKRLAEMGILPGVTVQMKRTAPMGDPIAFQVRGYQLSLRRSDAGLIRVREISDSPLHVAPLAEHTAPTTILPAGNDQP